MKKNILSLLSIVLCAVFVLTGCLERIPEDTSSGDISETSSEVSQEEISKEPDDVSQDETSQPDDPVDEPDYFAEHGHPVLPEKSEIPDYYLPTDTEFLYELNIDTSDFAKGQADVGMQANGDYMMLLHWNRGKEYATVYAISSGEKLMTVSIDYFCTYKSLRSDGSIACLIVDFDEGENSHVDILSADGSSEMVLELPAGASNAVLSEDGEYVICAVNDTDMYVYSVSQKSLLKKFEGIGDSYLYFTCVDYGFIVNDASWSRRIFLFETLEVSEFFSDESPAQSFGGFYHGYQDSGVMFYDGTEDGKLLYIKTGSSEFLSDCAFGWLITSSYESGAQVACLYDMRSSKLALKLPVYLDCDYFASYFLPDGRIAITAMCAEKTMLLVYDLPAFAESGYEGEDAEIFLTSAEEIEERTVELANEIFEKTGVEVLYGSQGNDFVIWDYVGAAELDTFVIYEKLITLRDILYKYPENMLRESYSETHKGLRMYLCGRIYGVSGNGGLTEAGAVTTEIDGYIVIAFNLNNSLKYDVPHELSHVFDRRISYVGGQTGVNYDEMWISANEIKNPYAYSYSDYWSLSSYTYGYESKDSKIWFVDSYSRTFPTEDRARIIENLFNSENGLEDCLTKEHLRDKAELYCRILRECFPSCASEAPFWEAFLAEEE